MAGAKKREEIYEAFETIYPVLQQFRKGDVQPPAPPAAAARQQQPMVRSPQGTFIIELFNLSSALLPPKKFASLQAQAEKDHALEKGIENTRLNIWNNDFW